MSIDPRPPGRRGPVIGVALALAATAAALGLGLPHLAEAGAAHRADAATPGGTVSGRPVAGSLVWADDFDGPAGSPPDPRRWNHETGGGGFGNSELEYYTDGT